MRAKQAGFTLAELLVVLFPMSLVAAGAVGFFTNHNRTYVQQDIAVSTEENLRAAMGMVTDTLRSAGCGVPASNLGNWITWVSGFDNDPVIVTDGGSGPDVVSVAGCTPMPIARLSAAAAAGSTSVSLISDYPGTTVSQLLNAADKSLILIGDSQHARVTSVSGNTVNIDTDPTTNGAQGLARAYLTGATITRVDVVTFQIETDADSGLPWLRLNRHRGSEDPAAEGISDLQITTLVPGGRYQIALTARSETVDPIAGHLLTRSLSSDVRLRN
jgi:prepilin-type N-terminal cleavage/methylation domain-containing protein